MQIEPATLVNVLGTASFMLALLFFFWFLASWLPSSSAIRQFTFVVTGLTILATVLAEAGVIWFGWTPPWQESGIITPPASTFDLIALAALMFIILGVWFVIARILPTEMRYRFSLWRVVFLTLACLIYELGMILLGWPAPWHLPIPSE